MVKNIDLIKHKSYTCKHKYRIYIIIVIEIINSFSNNFNSVFIETIKRSYIPRRCILPKKSNGIHCILSTV